MRMPSADIAMRHCDGGDWSRCYGENAGGQLRPGCCDVMAIGRVGRFRFWVDLRSRACDSEREARYRQRFPSATHTMKGVGRSDRARLFVDVVSKACYGAATRQPAGDSRPILGGGKENVLWIMIQ